MPLYGFDCKMCKHNFETIVHGGVEAGETCPNCGSTDTERENFPKKPASFVINGASAANNYGLINKPQGRRK